MVIWKLVSPILCRTNHCNLLAIDIQEKTPKEVKKYYPVFKKKWKQLVGTS
jgi:hypothetical protein